MADEPPCLDGIAVGEVVVRARSDVVHESFHPGRRAGPEERELLVMIEGDVGTSLFRRSGPYEVESLPVLLSCLVNREHEETGVKVGGEMAVNRHLDNGLDISAVVVVTGGPSDVERPRQNLHGEGRSRILSLVRICSHVEVHAERVNR